MSGSNKRVRLGAFLMATGRHVAMWRHPGAAADAGETLAHCKQLPRTAERAGCDMIFTADPLEEWFTSGAADGFEVMPPWLPDGLDDFTGLVIPELHQRGLFRTEHEGRTLRENPGLPRPENQFAQARSETVLPV